jgi:asparagine synthase (glutamine-hydrolysing)
VKSSNTPLKTFSIGFDEPSFDESRYARQMADHLGTEHHEKIFSVNDMKNLIPKIFASLDEPFADASVLATYFLCSYAKENVTVALSGDGGDEIFGGYPTYYARKLAEWIPPWTYSILKYGANLLPVSDDNISFDFKAKKFTEVLEYDPDVRHQYWLGSFNYFQKQSLFSDDLKYELSGKDTVTELVKSQMQYCDTEENWERSLWQDMRFYLQDNMLVKVDRVSMMNSLEVRVPLLDHEVVEFAARIPAKFKYRNTQSKYILKQMAKHHLPNEIVYRDKKGFGVPIAKWLKKELRSKFDDLVENSELCENLFNNDYLRKLQDDHLNNRKDNRKMLWAVLVLHECMENNSIK